MYNYSLSIYPALLLVLLCYRACIAPKGTYNKEFLSVNQTKMLQVFACLGVIMHHVTQGVTAYGSSYRGPVTILNSMGILFTSIFFFSSGYGLFTSYTTKAGYLDHFLSHRLTTVMVPFVTSNIVYVVVNSLLYHNIRDFRQLVSYISGYTLINSNGWFIIEIIFLYIAFFVFFKLIRNRDVALGCITIFTIALVLYSKSRGHDSAGSSWFMGEWWYNSTITFVMGLLVSRFKNTIMSIFSRCYRILLILMPVLFIGVFVIEEYVLNTRGYYKQSYVVGAWSNSTVTLLWQMTLCIVFMTLLLVINYKVSFSNRFLKGLSPMCTELFLIHHLFVGGFAEELLVRYNLGLHSRYLMAIIPSLGAAYLLSLLNRWILNSMGKCSISKEISLSDFGIKISRKKIIRGLIRFSILLLIALGVYLSTRIRFFAGRECVEEVKLLRESKIGDVISFGRYDTDSSWGKERLRWIVVDIEGSRYTLVTEQGIAGSSFHQQHTPVTWRDSDLRKKLTGKEYMSIFSSKERKLLVADEFGDLISILTPEQTADYFAGCSLDNLGDMNPELILTSTEMAKTMGVNVNRMSKINHWDFNANKASWWWLRSASDAPSLTAPIVSCDGEILLDTRYVNKAGGALRPVITIELD